MAANDLLSLLMGGSSAAAPPAQDSTPLNKASPGSPQAAQDPLATLFDAVRKEQSPLPPNAGVQPVSPSGGNAASLLSLFQQPSPLSVHTDAPQQASSPTPASTSASPAPLASGKAPPFTFLSPFDMLEAMTSKSRTPSNVDQVTTDPASKEVDLEELVASVEPEQLKEEAEPQEGHMQEPEQTIELDVDARPEAQIQQIPISRFSSEYKYSQGRRIACNGLISYSTRAGRIRVIDSASGARLIRKLHTGLVVDMAISSEVNGMRRLASCSPGRLSIWQVPAAFSSDDALNEVILDISSSPVSFRSVEFSPTDPDLLVAISDEGELYMLKGKRGVYEGSAIMPVLGQATPSVVSCLERRTAAQADLPIGCFRSFARWAAHRNGQRWHAYRLFLGWRHP